MLSPFCRIGRGSGIAVTGIPRPFAGRDEAAGVDANPEDFPLAIDHLESQVEVHLFGTAGEEARDPQHASFVDARRAIEPRADHGGRAEIEPTPAEIGKRIGSILCLKMDSSAFESGHSIGLHWKV